MQQSKRDPNRIEALNPAKEVRRENQGIRDWKAKGQSNIGELSNGTNSYEEAMQKQKHLEKIAKIIGLSICGLILLIYAIIFCHNMKQSNSSFEQSTKALSYEESFYETSRITLAVLDVKAAFNENEITKKQYRDFIKSYNNLVVFLDANNELPKKMLEKYNSNLKGIFGPEYEYLLETEKKMDIKGTQDGLTFWILEYLVEIAWETEKISDEEYEGYEEKRDQMLKNLSHENAQEFAKYAMNLIGYMEKYKMDI